MRARWLIISLTIGAWISTATADQADTPEDGLKLGALVNDAIDDVLSWPAPIGRDQLRTRLRKLAKDVDFFATEDREETYRYAIKIWRAAGFLEESDIFDGRDEFILPPLTLPVYRGKQ